MWENFYIFLTIIVEVRFTTNNWKSFRYPTSLPILLKQIIAFICYLFDPDDERFIIKLRERRKGAVSGLVGSDSLEEIRLIWWKGTNKIYTVQ